MHGSVCVEIILVEVREENSSGVEFNMRERRVFMLCWGHLGVVFDTSLVSGKVILPPSSPESDLSFLTYEEDDNESCTY